jgi:hypothetical protein
MAIDFPNSPSVNDTYSAGGKTWYYDGTGWTLRSVLTANGTIATSDLANNAVHYSKLGPTGATDGQALLANSATGTGLEWGQAGYAPDDVQTVLSGQVFGNG